MHLCHFQYERSKAAYDVLAASTDAKGRQIEVLKMPVPPPQHITEVTCLDTASCSSQSTPHRLAVATATWPTCG